MNGRTEIEYIMGERCTGKTTDIISQVTENETIGIVVMDHLHGRVFQSKLFPKYMRNVHIITKPEQCFGRHFDKVFIDDASYFDWERFFPMLQDSMVPEGGKIFIYLTIYPGSSVRILNKMEKAK